MPFRKRAFLGAAILGAATATAHSATLVAQYQFQANFNSGVAGAPPLMAVDPTGTSGFETDTVLGATRSVYAFDGSSAPSFQGGLVFDDSSGIVPSNDYSIDLEFKFSSQPNTWRRIFDAQNRQSDDGFYVDPGNNLDLYPAAGGGGQFSTGVYHNVALTVGPDDVVSAYLDDVLAFTTTTPIMNLNNPQNVFDLFLDNDVGPNEGEYSPGSIAIASFYAGVLSAGDVAALNANPFPTNSIPEPAALTMFAVALAGSAMRRRKRS